MPAAWVARCPICDNLTVPTPIRYELKDSARAGEAASVGAGQEHAAGARGRK